MIYASPDAQINQAICNRATDDTPLMIYIKGTNNHGNTAKHSGSCDAIAKEIQFKGVKNISLIGVGSAVCDQVGILQRDTFNLSLQILRIKNVKTPFTYLQLPDFIEVSDNCRNMPGCFLLRLVSSGQESSDDSTDIKA